MKYFYLIFLNFVLIQSSFLQSFTKYNFTNSDVFSSGAFVADLNNDQFPDIIAGDRQEINIYINNKNGKSYEKYLLTTTSVWQSSFTTFDVDGDNDIDILVGVEGKVLLFRNISTATEFKFEKVDEDFYNFSGLTNSVPILSKGDINNDEKIDVIVAYGYTDALIQRANYKFSKHRISENIRTNIKRIEVEDLNNDNKLDIILTTGDQNINFYINKGDESFLTENVIYGNDYKDFIVCDLNGDSYNDVVTFDYSWDSHMKIFENSKSTFFSFEEKNISSNIIYNFSSLAKGDFNNDNKVDFIVGFEQTAGISLILNTTVDSNYKFNFKNVTQSSGISLKLFVNDFDLDGDDDILQLSEYGGFNIYLNGIISGNNDETVLSVSLFPNPAIDFIRLNSKNLTNCEITIYNSLGHFVHKEYYQFNQEINISNLISGIYTIDLKYENGKKQKMKFLKL